MRFVMNRELIVVAVFNLVLSPAWGACVKPPASAQIIGQFKLNPQGLIPSADSEAQSVEIRTRELAGTDARLAESLVQIAETANPKFQMAIAAGLAQAALACENTDQQAAEQIQQAVAGFQNGQFQSAFAAVAGDIGTAAAGAAATWATAFWAVPVPAVALVAALWLAVALSEAIWGAAVAGVNCLVALVDWVW